jgi:hypothetical protein
MNEETKMRRSFVRQAPKAILLGMLATGLLAGCIGEDNPQPQPPQPPALNTQVATATASSPGPAEPTPGTTLPSPVPVLTLSANRSLDVELFQGWPLLFEVSLMHPDCLWSDEQVEPLEVGADGSPWSGAITLAVVDAEGKAQTWPMRLAGTPEGGVMLDSESMSTVYFALGPEETAKLEEGAYAVTASLDTASQPSGWRGKAESIPAILTVSEAPAELTAEQESVKAQMLAGQAVALGDRAEAMSLIDALLDAQPDNIGALEFKGDLLAEEGKTSEALDAYNMAIKAFYEQNESAEEAPSVLAQKQHEMMDRLLGE